MIKLFYILIGLFLVCTGIGAQDKILYDSLLNRVQDLSVEQVIQKGDTCLAKQHQDTAIVLYTIAFSRFHNGKKSFAPSAILKPAMYTICKVTTQMLWTYISRG